MTITLFGLLTVILYWVIEPKQDRDWAPEHSKLASIKFKNNKLNPDITVLNMRNFQWNQDSPQHYQNMQFKLQDIVKLKAGVSHFSAINDIAHIFMTFLLSDGRELGVSIEARREKGERFSLHGGLMANFELIYVLATPEDLLTVRQKDKVHIYPIKATEEKAQELFLLITKEVNALTQKPKLYHLFFKNCTNQLVKHVSILTKEKYPWYFQTLAPGLTGRMLYELDLIDMPEGLSFSEIQENTHQ